MLFDTQTAREFAAKSHEARRRNKELREEASQAESQFASPLEARARELDELLQTLKDDLRKARDAGDKLKLCQAIDRLEQSYARYAGIPGPGNLKPLRPRRALPNVEPLDP